MASTNTGTNTTPAPWAKAVEANPNATRIWKVAKASKGGRLYALIVRADSRKDAIRATAGKGQLVDCFEINENGTIIG